MEDPRITVFKREMEKVLSHLHGEFAKLQTGRANAAILENISVEVYGQKMSLKSLAGISVQDARSMVVQPWDRSILHDIEKALQKADLGSAPVNDGTTLRINLPPMTQERREQMGKLIRTLAEEAKISVRQQRQGLHDQIKSTEKDEDARFTLLEDMQKAVDETNKKIEESMEKKEEEIMTV